LQKNLSFFQIQCPEKYVYVVTHILKVDQIVGHIFYPFHEKIITVGLIMWPVSHPEWHLLFYVQFLGKSDW